MNDQNNIYSFVRTFEIRYKTGTTKIAKYVDHSLSEVVQTIYAYLNSKHISGEFDSLNRDKPFFNIVTAARNIWYRATEIARNKIIIRETDSTHVISAFLATQKLQEWMRKERFGVFLVEWGLVLAGFGSAVSKFVEKKGQLIATVVPWNQIMCDTVDFENNPKIEIFEFTPAQLRQNPMYDQVMVESLIQATMIRMLVTGELQDTKPDFIKVYEAHGMFPVSYLTENIDDKYDYAQQMQVVSYVRSEKEGEYKDFTLYKGREAKDPYRKDDLIKEDGRTLGIGAVENLFNAQWMVNHSIKGIKDQLDLASKLIFQTADSTFVGQNVLVAIETGQILQHAEGKPVTAFPNGSHDTGSFTAFMDQWKAIGGEINGITDAMAGVAPKGSTSWRMQSMELQQAQMLFDLMKRNKGLAIEDMLRENIIPFLKKQLNTKKQIIATLAAHDIKKIDAMYIPQEATRRFNKKVISHVVKNGRMPMNASLQNEMQQVQTETAAQGNTRYFKPSDISSKTWKEIFKDLEWEVECDITEESSDTAGILQTLNTSLQIVMNPGYAQSPQAQMIVSKILLLTGKVSPLEMSLNSVVPSNAAPPSAGAKVAAPNALSAIGNNQ